MTAGITPTRTSLNANVAVATATAISQAATRPMPPARPLPASPCRSSSEKTLILPSFGFPIAMTTAPTNPLTVSTAQPQCLLTVLRGSDADDTPNELNETKSLVPLAIILLGYFARVRLPLNLPAGLVAGQRPYIFEAEFLEQKPGQ